MRSVFLEDLKPGMILARSLINDDLIVILSEGTLLTKAHITRLGFLRIPSVYVKDEYELSSAFQTVAKLFNPGNAFVTEYKEVMNTARSIFDETHKSGKAPVAKSQSLIHRELAPMSKQSGAIDYLLEVNHLAADVYNHSVRVSVLAGVLAKWLQMSTEETHDVIMAGFLHDIGKTNFPERLHNKRPENLKGEDLEAYMQHTVDGQKILTDSGGLSEGVCVAAGQHHECMDGTGFPFGAKGEQIHRYARIIALVDLYDNITTEREGQRKCTPFEAIDRITEDMYTRLDPGMCVPFLTHIKEAFLGSRVKLNNGAVGTIVRYTNDYTSQPLIRVSQEELIDLNLYPELKIIEYNPK